MFLTYFSDIDSEFKQFMYELIPHLLKPENLVIKKINGIPMTGKGLLQCFQVFTIYYCYYMQVSVNLNDLAFSIDLYNRFSYRGGGIWDFPPPPRVCKKMLKVGQYTSLLDLRVHNANAGAL